MVLAKSNDTEQLPSIDSLLPADYFAPKDQEREYSLPLLAVQGLALLTSTAAVSKSVRSLQWAVLVPWPCCSKWNTTTRHVGAECLFLY